MRRAKIFKHGNGQAVQLPKEFRFDGREVMIKRTAAGILLLPMTITRERLAAALAPLRGTFERRQPALGIPARTTPRDLEPEIAPDCRAGRTQIAQPQRRNRC